MKCPKCGYNSFETYDACKKCGSDLVAFKQSLGIRPILYPPGFAAEREDLFSTQAGEQALSEAASAEAISWDMPEERAGSREEPFAGFDLDFGDSDSPSGGFRFDMEGRDPAAESSLFEQTPQAIDGPDAADSGFDLDDFLVHDQPGGPAAEEGGKQAPPSLNLSDDWPSFLDEEKKGKT